MFQSIQPFPSIPKQFWTFSPLQLQPGRYCTTRRCGRRHCSGRCSTSKALLGLCGAPSKGKPTHPSISRNQSITLQGINISHLGKRKIIFKMPFLGDMLLPWRLASLKLTISPLKMMVSNRNLLFQGSIFRGEMLVSGRVLVGVFLPTHWRKHITY